MKLSLPITPRYALPLLAALLLLDIAVAATVAFTLYRAADRIRTIEVDAHDCQMYSPKLIGATYVVARCSSKEAP